MMKLYQDNQAEPFVVAEDVEAELAAAGYEFEPPGHARTISLPKILAGLSDAELAT